MVPSYRKMQQEEDEKKESNVPTGNKIQQRTKKGTDFLYTIANRASKFFKWILTRKQ